MQISLIILFLVAFTPVWAQKNDELINGRGMSIRERLALKNKAQDEIRNKSVPVEEQSAQFFSTLQAQGAEAGRGKLQGMDRRLIDKEQGVVNEDAFSQLQDDMNAKGGKIKEYNQVGAVQDSLNGHQKKVSYVIMYENGKTREVELLYIKPDISGGFKLMDVKVKE